MGVRGLTTFVDCNPQLLTDIQLHDTKVIIDGNNLYHFLYYHFKVPFEYGGNYDQFAASCEVFFHSLVKCNIKPYVVFDGAYAADGNKFKTSMERARERIHVCGLLASGSRCGKVLPIITHDAFCFTLTRLSIPHVTFDFEADQQVAALAKSWNCPVLTNDSDFFIYDLPSGVILLDYFNMAVRKQKQPDSNDYHYLSGQIFYVANLMKFLQIRDHSLVVLLATLLGNDLIDGRHFDSFFARAKLPKGAMKKLAAKRQAKIASAVGWLQSVHSVKEAVDFVLSELPHDKHNLVGTLIQQSLDSYMILSTDLDDYFSSMPQNAVTMPANQSAVVAPNCAEIPECFTQAIREGHFPVALLNVFVNRRVLLLCQVESMKEVNSYSCALSLRRIAYGILLSVDINSAAGLNPARKLTVSEYSRENKSMKCMIVEPVLEVSGRPVPALNDMLQVDSKERYKFLMAALGSSQCAFASDGIPDRLEFLVKVIEYWIQNVNPKITVLHLHALLLCLLKLGTLDHFFFSDAKLVSTASDEIMKDLEQTDGLKTAKPTAHDQFLTDQTLLSSVKRHLESLYLVTPKHNNAVLFDIGAIHSFAQFQTCLQAAGWLCQLLFLHDISLDPATVFNGTFLYNALRDLRSRSNPNAYIVQALLSNSLTLSSRYQRLFEAICSNLPEHCFEEIVTPKAKKKTKRKKAGKNNDVEIEAVSDLMPTATVIESMEQLVANCDIDNKFNCLLLADN